jgi:hypothetical protein
MNDSSGTGAARSSLSSSAPANDRSPSSVRQRFVLAEARERHHAAVFNAEPAPPVWGFDVADVGHTGIRVAAFQGGQRRRHAPPRHDQFTTFRLIADNRSAIIRIYAGQQRQVASPVVHCAGQFTDRLLAFRQGIKPMLITATCCAFSRRHRREHV